MKQAEMVHDPELPTNLPGIKAMQLKRFDGKTWVLFGDIFEAGS